MKQQFVITHQQTILQETEKPHWSSIDQHLACYVFKKCKDKQFFCGHNILTEVEFVNQPSSNARISIWRIVWVMTNCHFKSTMWIIQSLLHLFCSLINIPNSCELTALKIKQVFNATAKYSFLRYFSYDNEKCVNINYRGAKEFFP